jgi:hypothetical protein
MAINTTIHGVRYGATLAIHLTQVINSTKPGQVTRAHIKLLDGTTDAYHLRWVGEGVLYATNIQFPAEVCAFPFTGIARILITATAERDPLGVPGEAAAPVEATA